MNTNFLPVQELRYRGQVPASNPSVASVINRQHAAPQVQLPPQVTGKGLLRVKRRQVCGG